jgi:hypothetical protein
MPGPRRARGKFVWLLDGMNFADACVHVCVCVCVLGDGGREGGQQESIRAPPPTPTHPPPFPRSNLVPLLGVGCYNTATPADVRQSTFTVEGWVREA